MQYLKEWGLSILISIVIIAYFNADIKIRTGEKTQCNVGLGL